MLTVCALCSSLQILENFQEKERVEFPLWFHKQPFDNYDVTKIKSLTYDRVTMFIVSSINTI